MSSSSRRRSRHSSGSANSNMITDDQIAELVSKLCHLLPEIRSSNRGRRKVASVLQETCNYITSLHSEIDDLSTRLSHLLSTVDEDGPEAAMQLLGL